MDINSDRLHGQILFTRHSIGIEKLGIGSPNPPTRETFGLQSMRIDYPSFVDVFDTFFVGAPEAQTYRRYLPDL
jgi:hypothetical protein